ncbi:hypothetical protein BJ912DRAFT_343792 [Pholiota molesta]|nr:hypothetical protein BJ912DRAFT_343792 [Pholiota molesta]
MGKRKRKTQEVFHVEVITKARVVLHDPSPGDKKQKPQSDWEYYVKWAGYDSDANSWEPHENVESCERLLESFWNHIGNDDNDYFPGYIVSASEEWIEMEKKFFAREYQAEKKRRQEETRPKKKAKKSSHEPSTSVASTSKAHKVVIVIAQLVPHLKRVP